MSGAQGSGTFTFLVDTGWTLTTFNSKVCNAIHCTLENSSVRGWRNTLQKASGGTISAGPYRFTLDSFRVSEDLSHLPVDGVLGSDVLFSKNLFLDLKNHKFCITKLPMAEVAGKLGLIAIPAEISTSAWVTLRVTAADGNILGFP